MNKKAYRHRHDRTRRCRDRKRRNKERARRYAAGQHRADYAAGILSRRVIGQLPAEADGSFTIPTTDDRRDAA